VEFKRRAQLDIYEDIQGMTHEQERAYFERQTERGPIADWWKRIKAAEHPGINRNTPQKKLDEYGLEK
jgi:hypothetical protein